VEVQVRMTDAGRDDRTPAAAGHLATHSHAAPSSALPVANEWPPPGREADALVGQRVFGWTIRMSNWQPYAVSITEQNGTTWTHRRLVPAFTTDVRAALQLVEQLADPATRHGVELVRDATGRWHARFVRWGRASPRFTTAATLPEAICLAALTAVEFFAQRDATAPPGGGADSAHAASGMGTADGRDDADAVNRTDRTAPAPGDGAAPAAA
jgi:hypothetical protein